jgi:competence protein ComEA
MDVGPPTTVDVDAAIAEVRRQVRVEYRVYLVVVAVVSLVVGGLIVAFTMREEMSRANVLLTPPPYWGQVCVSTAPDVKAVPVLTTVTPQSLHVYITGAVMHPGVVAVPAGSLLADAVDAAGGTTTDADLESVNLAAPLVDNQHVTIPRRAVTATPQPAAAATVALPATLVNINTATATELETLPHIGTAMAQRIIAYREANGPFQRIEDLQKVEGIGETRYKDIAPLITVGP